MAVCQESVPHSLMPGGRAAHSPSFYYPQGPGGQGGGAYGPDPTPYPASQYGPPLPYLAPSPSLQQQGGGQGGGGGEEMSAAGGPQGWHFPGVHGRPAGVEEWKEWTQQQQYLSLHAATHPYPHPRHPLPHHHHHDGNPLHPNHPSHPYGYGYRAMEGLEPQALPGGLDSTSSSAEGSSPPGGSAAGGGAGGKQLRPPFEWMKPTNVQPVPGKTRTKDKYRVVYSDHQRLELEKEFHFSRYITIRRKAEIAQHLNLSERQVKIWFQNRRAKERKQNKKRDELRNGTAVPKLEPMDSPPPITSQPLSHGMRLQQQQHMINQSAVVMPFSAANHLPVSMPQPGYGVPQKLSPSSLQAMANDNHIHQQMATPSAVAQLSDLGRAATLGLVTPKFEEKCESS